MIKGHGWGIKPSYKKYIYDTWLLSGIWIPLVTFPQKLWDEHILGRAMSLKKFYCLKLSFVNY